MDLTQCEFDELRPIHKVTFQIVYSYIGNESRRGHSN